MQLHIFIPLRMLNCRVNSHLFFLLFELFNTNVCFYVVQVYYYKIIVEIV